MEKKKPYRYCVVPCCTNTTIKTPTKYFFHIPNDAKIRKKWCNLMRRDDKKPLSTKTSMHCCEDHFNVESDAENLIKWRMLGGTLKLKRGVVPTKFDCQKRNTSPKPTRPAVEKRRRIEFYEKLLCSEVQPSVAQQPVEFHPCENEPMVLGDDEPPNPLPIDNTLQVPEHTKKVNHKGIQVEQKKQNAQTQTFIKKQERKVNVNQDESFDSNKSSASRGTEILLTSCSESSQMSNELTVIDNRKGTIIKIQNNPKLYCGIPKESFFIINLLVEKTKVSYVDVLISLKKIKLNDSYDRLAIDFNMHKSNIGRIFRKTIPLLANCFKEIIFFPSKKSIKQHLPIPFRKRYSKTVSIIDCFEIRIEKPTNALHQALSWSQYKSCNTIKYLVSITPDGLITFVSPGYGGRTSDTEIFVDSKILDHIPKGGAIMADRGFKNIAPEVEMYGCHLVKPPSVSVGKPSTKEEVMETKRIAALRIHVERSISRLREFKLTSPHACVDTKVIDILDYIVLIVCGIVNLQSKLV